MIATRLAFVALLSAAACGGDVKADTPVAAVAIGLYGDSTNDGIDGRTGERASPDPRGALQGLLDARFGAGLAGVDNRAVSGTSSGDIASLSGDFQIAVVNFGINDARLGVPLETYHANLRRLYRPGVVFKTPSPTWETAYDVAPFAEAMRSVAREVGAPLIDTNRYVLGLADWRALIPDRVHPTGALYELIAVDSMTTLAPMVAAALCAQGVEPNGASSVVGRARPPSCAEQLSSGDGPQGE